VSSASVLIFTQLSGFVQQLFYVIKSHPPGHGRPQAWTRRALASPGNVKKCFFAANVV